MTVVSNSNVKIQVESVRFRSAASESTMQLIGGAINQLFDDRDAEIAARIAADAVLQGEINTNTSDISTLTGRVNAVRGVTLGGDFQFVVNPTGGSDDIQRYQWLPGTTWVLNKINGGPFGTVNYTITPVYDTTFPVANTFISQYCNATFANLFFNVKILNYNVTV